MCQCPLVSEDGFSVIRSFIVGPGFKMRRDWRSVFPDITILVTKHSAVRIMSKMVVMRIMRHSLSQAEYTTLTT